MNRGQVQQPCEEQVQPKEIKELIIVIRQQTMTKKMLVKTESVDMTGVGEEFRAQMGEAGTTKQM